MGSLYLVIFIKISSDILPRKFYFRILLVLGRITGAVSAQIAQAYDTLLTQAPPMPPLPNQVRRPSRRGVGVWAMVGVFGTDIGTPPASRPGWKAVVASYQSLYSVDTMVADAISAEQVQVQLAQVSQLIGADLTDLP